MEGFSKLTMEMNNMVNAVASLLIIWILTLVYFTFSAHFQCDVSVPTTRDCIIAELGEAGVSSAWGSMGGSLGVH